MPESLLIVESPTKARTLTKYLGKEFTILASMGHIKDLPKTKMGVDIENGFKPEYRVIEGKKKIIAKIKKAAKDTVSIYLAPDPDREGEAIAWHIAEEIGTEHGKIYRVLFNEITEKGIQEGLKNVQELDESKYESQQARRILDRLVGYELSPLLWKKVKRGLSAGRVQSVALRIIVDREKEIFVFKSTEYWKIFCDLERSDGSGGVFRTQVTHRNGEKLEIPDTDSAQQARDHLDASAFTVKSIKKQKRRRNPPAPFITSRLQQEATRKLWMSAKQVMQVAQQLYEGVEIGNEGAVGLITYMRTDSTRMSADAVAECRGFIGKTFGAEYLPGSPKVYPQKKSAQGAHEAIRPTSMNYPPEKIRHYLSEDQLKLYSMIWRRYVACQMNPAVYNETKVVVEASPSEDAETTYTLSAVGSSIEFDGWLAAEPESRPVVKKKKKDEESDEANGGEDEKNEEDAGPVNLPELNAKDNLHLAGEKVMPQQKFTKPPPRFTEGSLVKELEDKGIGRPSTYASIITTIAGRQYVRKFKYRLYPTALGEIVVGRLVKHFPEVLDIEFTAKMEESLDKIESKNAKGIDILKNFYAPFHRNIEDALKTMKAGIDPDEYKNSCAQSASGGVFAPLEVETPCPKCGKKMVLKSGRFGFFLSCRDYPKCRESLPPYSGVKCPLPDCDGEVVEIKLKKKDGTRGKRNFYGCSHYSDNGCKFTIWDTPLMKECSKCGSKLMVIKREKGGARLVCQNEACKHGEDIPY